MKLCGVWHIVREAGWSYLLGFCLVPLLLGRGAGQPAFCPEGPAPSGWWVLGSQHSYSILAAVVGGVSTWPLPLGISGRQLLSRQHGQTQTATQLIGRIRLTWLQVKRISNVSSSFPLVSLLLGFREEWTWRMDFSRNLGKCLLHVWVLPGPPQPSLHAGLVVVYKSPIGLWPRGCLLSLSLGLLLWHLLSWLHCEGDQVGISCPLGYRQSSPQG